MSYGIDGENKVPCHTLDHTFRLRAICPPCHSGPYVRSQDRMSALTSFRENLIFSPLSTYSPTSEASVQI
jgi:hypothetical protein